MPLPIFMLVYLINEDRILWGNSVPIKALLYLKKMLFSEADKIIAITFIFLFLIFPHILAASHWHLRKKFLLKFFFKSGNLAMDQFNWLLRQWNSQHFHLQLGFMTCTPILASSLAKSDKSIFTDKKYLLCEGTLQLELLQQVLACEPLSLQATFGGS